MHLERLLDNLALDIEAFAVCQVARGWRLRLPSLDWVTFHFVVRGHGEAHDSGADAKVLSPGSLLLVPPHLIHSLECGPPPHAEQGVEGERRDWVGLPEYRAGPDEGSGLLVVCGRAQLLHGSGRGVFDHLREILAMDFADEPKMTVLFETMLTEVRSPRPGSRAMVSALMEELVVHVFRHLSADAGADLPWLDALEAPDLESAVRSMLADPAAPHTVATLAGLCHMSRSTFARRFKQSFGHPPMEYLRQIRLRHAARLLRREPRPAVGWVARRVGFRSRSHFSRAFKDFFDATPSGYAEGRRSRRLFGPLP